MTDPDYRVEVTVGAHSFEATWPTTPPGNAVTLPLTIGWSIPEAVDYFPTQANPTSGSFGIVCDSVADVNDLTIGDPVTVAVYAPSTAPDPWQYVRGVVTQLDAQVGDRNLVTVYFTDPTWLLSQMVVGLVDWPIESVSDRLDRIAAEAGIVVDTVGITAEGLVGLLAARSAGATDALSAIRSAMKDTASRNLSYDPDAPIYGRHVYAYDPISATLRVFNWERRVLSWPGELGADGLLHRRVGEPDALDGNAVTTSGRWSRLRGDRTTYVLVDGIPFGDPDAPGAVPYVRNTGYVDGPGPTFPSATARTFLGRSLLPGEDRGDVWRTDTVRHLSYLDPVPVERWIGNDDSLFDDAGFAWAKLRPTMIEPVQADVTLDGRNYIAGLLTSARLTIPPGGRFYIDLALRPELQGVIAATSIGAATYADVPPALTYADLDPLLTYRDLRLIGA